METNKYIELDKNDQNMVGLLAHAEVRRCFKPILGETNVNNLSQHFKQELFKLLTEKEATILNLTRERDAYKRQVK